MKRTRHGFAAVFVLALGVLALVFSSGASARAQGEITLLAVGPMRAPTQKIVDNFQAKTGFKVKVTYGNGAETRRTVAKGQPLDVSLIIAPFPGALTSGSIVLSSATPIVGILTAVARAKGAAQAGYFLACRCEESAAGGEVHRIRRSRFHRRGARTLGGAE